MNEQKDKMKDAEAGCGGWSLETLLISNYLPEVSKEDQTLEQKWIYLGSGCHGDVVGMFR